MSGLEAQFLGVYRVKDIQEILQIGQVAAYRLIHSGEFPVIAVGRSYRIPQKEFHEWLHRNRGPVKYGRRNHTAVVFSAVESDPFCILSRIKNGDVRT